MAESFPKKNYWKTRKSGTFPVPRGSTLRTCSFLLMATRNTSPWARVAQYCSYLSNLRDTMLDVMLRFKLRNSEPSGLETTDVVTTARFGMRVFGIGCWTCQSNSIRFPLRKRNWGIIELLNETIFIRLWNVVWKICVIQKLFAPILLRRDSRWHVKKTFQVMR